jgi:hypothetical protein
MYIAPIMKNEATRTNFGRPRRPYPTDGILFMRGPAEMVQPCRALVSAIWCMGLTAEQVERLMEFLKEDHAKSPTP